MAHIDQEYRREFYESLKDIPPLVRLPDSMMGSIADLPEAKLLEVYTVWLHHQDRSNGKRFSVAQLMLDAEKAGRIYPGATAIMASSGNAVVNLGYNSDAWGLERVIAVVNKSISEGKKSQFLIAGCYIAYPREGQTPIERAIELEKAGVGRFINQYLEVGAILGQKKGPMEHIIREMGRMGKTLSFASIAAGTCATICAAELLKEVYPWMQIIGVGCEDKIVPGARTLADIERDITFGWRKAIGEENDLVLCDQYSAFARSAENVEKKGGLFGPTWGLALEGFFRRFRHLSERRELERFINLQGKYVAVIPSMDMPIVYPEYNVILGLEKKVLVQ
jgi:cysteine synthase